MRIGPIELWNQQLLDIVVNDGSIYQTIILKIGKQELMLQHPSNQEGPLVPVRSQEVSVFLSDEHSNRYVYETNLSFVDNRFVLPIPTPEQIKKVQRRQFFRVPAILEMTLKKTLNLDEDEVEEYKVVTDDISAGGLSFHLFNLAPFHRGDMLTVEIDIEGAKKTTRCIFEAQVVNITKMDAKRTRYALEFKIIREMYRQEIMSFCMKRQAEIRKKIGD
ncbi:PilZ domain-containing protein [Paenibacillus albiflavus]|uniref:PilZ domain-containing protein n=1 Tax=Paenibacillus albiflavus TaxID=2545760 RepID=A0A4R4EKM1_9BACL|nr:PilZ domain-containing protein [Paenibacillus albiflavus]TCZ78835.1 PilZ domain-containing protein [Paenibacillus albiflavus]